MVNRHYHVESWNGPQWASGTGRHSRQTYQTKHEADKAASWERRFGAGGVIYTSGPHGSECHNPGPQVHQDQG